MLLLGAVNCMNNIEKPRRTGIPALLAIFVALAFPALSGAQQYTFYFPRVMTVSNTLTGLALSNPTADAAAITMTYYNTAGTVIGNPAVLSVAGSGQTARLLTEFYPG